MTDDLAYWLAAVHLPPVAPRKLLRCVEAFKSMRALFQGDERDWVALGLSPAVIAGLRAPHWTLVEAALAWGARPQHHLVPMIHPAYPKLLKEIANPPLFLFVRGDLDALSCSQMAIVGSRTATSYGTTQAARFAAQLVQAGFAITSGLALGIDAASHRGALAHHGITIGVAGTGLNRLYPRSHQALVEEMMAAKGAIVSEFPLDAGPLAYHFPQRNRIISGLSRGVLVVEAALKSGSLSTARHALDQGREVFAMPGMITNTQAQGCHHLIRQGAKLVETVSDILEEFDLMNRVGQVKATAPSQEKEANLPHLSSAYQTLLQHIEAPVTPMDVIVVRSGLTVSEVSSMLLHLELEGHVRAVAGGYTR